MRNGKIKRVLGSLMGAFLMFLLSGCSGEDMDKVVDNWKSDMQYRIKLNQDEVERLRASGLMPDSTADAVNKAIEAQADRVFALGLENVKKYIVNASGLAANAVGSGLGEDAEALDIVTTDKDSLIDNWLKTLSYDIYVLKADPLNTGKGENALATLDIISKEIDKAKSANSAVGTKIDNYFVSTGKKVWDTDKEENKILKDTVSSGLFNSTTQNVNIIGKHFIGVKHSPIDDTIISKVEIKLNEFNTDAVTRLIGADGVNKDKFVVIGNKCYLMEYPVQYVKGFTTTDNNEYKADYEESEMSINLLTKEIRDKNGNICQGAKGENILSVTGDSDTKYAELGKSSFVVDGVAGKEPSVGYLPKGKSLENTDKYGRVILRDYLELNYMPNVVEGESLVALGRRVRLTKFKGEGDNEIGLFIDREGNKVENSLVIKISDIMDVEQGLSSGKRNKLRIKTTTSDESGENTEDSEQGESSNSENPEENSENNESTSIGGVGTSQLELLETVYVNKVVSSTIVPGTLVAKQDKREMILNGGVGNGDNTGDAGTNNEGENGESEGTDANGEDGNSEVGDPDGVDEQPNGDGEQPNVEDVNRSEQFAIKQFFYGIAVDIDPFRSNLFSGWINITEDTPKGSLDWWNAWLKETGYVYQVNRDKVVRFLTGNYAYELGENGYLVLDMNTIKRIQSGYDEEDKVGLVSWVNTLFVILGFVILGYSILLMTAWVYDTNMIAGPRMFSLLTLGRWKAIASVEELPNYNTDNKHYMTFRKTIRSVFVLLILGLLLLFVDIVEIVDALIAIFGGIVIFLANVVRG